MAEKLEMHLPGMYADHHVTRVRQLLLATKGVEHVWASALQRVVVVDYDPQIVDTEAIRTALAEAGYEESLEHPNLMGKGRLSPWYQAGLRAAEHFSAQ